MDLGRRFDIAVVAFVFLVFLATVYLTKDFLSTILLSVVLAFLLKPLYAVIYRITKHGQVSSLLSILIVFVVILAVLLALTTVLLAEISNLEQSGAISNVQVSTITQDLDQWVQSKLPAWLYQYLYDTCLLYTSPSPRD